MWWDGIDIISAARGRGSVEQLSKFSLYNKALRDSKCVFEFYCDGNLLGTKEELLQSIEQLGGRYVLKDTSSKTLFTAYSLNYEIVWSDESENGLLSLSFDTENWAYIKITSVNEKLVEKVKLISQKFLAPDRKGKAYVFVSGPDGPELRKISDNAGIPLERGNYTDNVLSAFDHIVKDLLLPKPCGRAVIFEGGAGLGKTYLIRGISAAIEKATFVLVQPSMISDMMGPSFLPVLMEHANSKQPIIFIIEDADAVLVQRQSDNIHSISSLLNLGAGMFGDFLDVRLLLTTNAAKLDIDPAITRKGRCCRYVEVEKLPHSQAEKIYQRLTNSDNILPTNNKNYSLGEIYSYARDFQEQKEEVQAKPYTEK